MFSRSTVGLIRVLTPVHGLLTLIRSRGVRGPFPDLCRCASPPPEPRVPAGTRCLSVGTVMPQKRKAVKGQRVGGASGDSSEGGPVTKSKTGGVSIVVRAKPGSKQSSITDVTEEAVGVAIAAPPTDGEANAELIRYVAEVLELRRSHVNLDKGSRSRDKLLRLDTPLSPEEVLRRLREAAG